VDSVQSAKFITDRKSNQLIKKLESLASKYEGSQLHRQVFISGRVKTMNESIYYNVDELHGAINSDRQIRFRYYDWNLKKELEPRFDGRWYQLSPWALMWDDEMYYLVVYDDKHDQITHYRVDKIKDIMVTDEPRKGQDAFKEFDIAHYTKTLFGMYAGEETKVTLEASNHMAGVLIDRFGKDIVFAPIDDDHFRTVVNVIVSSHFFGWLMSLGGDIRVVGPDNVVDQMKAAIRSISEQYNI
jgi:predicted DNA-binding transcriptional regulator YafY